MFGRKRVEEKAPFDRTLGRFLVKFTSLTFDPLLPSLSLFVPSFLSLSLVKRDKVQRCREKLIRKRYLATPPALYIVYLCNDATTATVANIVVNEREYAFQQRRNPLNGPSRFVAKKEA